MGLFILGRSVVCPPRERTWYRYCLSYLQSLSQYSCKGLTQYLTTLWCWRCECGSMTMGCLRLAACYITLKPHARSQPRGMVEWFSGEGTAKVKSWGNILKGWAVILQNAAYSLSQNFMVLCLQEEDNESQIWWQGSILIYNTLDD